MDNSQKYNSISARRFPKYQLDGKWEEDTVENLFTFIPNNTLSRIELNYEKGDVLNIHYGDILIKFGDCLDVKKEVLPYITDDGIARKLSNTTLKAGDVVIADTAEDESAGKCTEIINLTNESIVAGLHTIAIRPKREFASRYLGFYMNSNLYRSQLFRLMQGVKVTSISKSALKTTTIRFPSSIEEQSRIAELLFLLDGIITECNNKLELLKSHKKGLMQKLFPAKGQKVPELRFKDFKKDGDWEEKRLGDVAEVFQGYGFPEKIQGKTKGKYPFIKVSDISATSNKGCWYINNAANYVDEEDVDLLKATPFPKGTIVFAKIGEAIRLNRRVILGQDSLIDNNVAGVKAILDQSIDEFLYYILLLVDLVKYAGGVVPAVKKSSIEEIEILLPPTLAEQVIIANSLLSIDNIINQYSYKINITEKYKQGLMQQLFPIKK